jgi:hypothetical protein
MTSAPFGLGDAGLPFCYAGIEGELGVLRRSVSPRSVEALVDEGRLVVAFCSASRILLVTLHGAPVEADRPEEHVEGLDVGLLGEAGHDLRRCCVHVARRVATVDLAPAGSRVMRTPSFAAEALVAALLDEAAAIRVEVLHDSYGS